MDSSSTITDWITAVRHSDESAARKLWDTYVPRLQKLARGWIQATGLYDEEDVAISAYQTLCQKLRTGHFTDVNSRDSFWALLAMIASRKANDLAKRDRTLKRGGIQTVGLDNTDELNLAASAGSQPDIDLLMAEECKVLLDQLGDSDLRQVTLLRLEGFTNPEIAEQLKLTLRSVQRMVKLIKEIWEKRAND